MRGVRYGQQIITGARTREALIEATGRALNAVTTQDTLGFFGYCGSTHLCDR